MLDIFQVPILNDNYVYVLHELDEGVVAIVDPGEADPVIEFLEDRNLKPNFILNTHHHDDHIGGNGKIKQKYGCKIVAPKGEGRIGDVDIEVSENDQVSIGSATVKVIETPGHTTHHIMYYFENDAALFCGDTLFSIGCGRLFEGTAEQMFKSLSKIKSLPDETRVYCAHEYTQNNIKFAKTIIPDNAALDLYSKRVDEMRRRDVATIPSLLGTEKKANPFLLAETAKEFADYRKRKDCF